MPVTLTTGQKAVFTKAINLMLQGQAYETPHDERVAEAIAPVARDIGFVASDGAYLEAIRNNPVSTLLELALYIGT